MLRTSTILERSDVMSVLAGLKFYYVGNIAEGH